MLAFNEREKDVTSVYHFQRWDIDIESYSLTKNNFQIFLLGREFTIFLQF